MKTKNSRLKMVLTGAARGLGNAMSNHFASNNYDLVISDIDFNTVKNLSKTIVEKTGATVIPMKVDVSSEEDIVKMMNFVGNEFNRLDVLISNIGIIETKEIINHGYPLY